MNSKIDILDEELDQEVNKVAKFLVFDLVSVRSIRGELGLYHGKLTFEMSNNDIIDFDYYTPYPGDSRVPEYNVSINGCEKFKINQNDEDLDDHFGYYIKDLYKQYLQHILINKSQPKNIFTSFKNGKVELTFS